MASFSDLIDLASERLGGAVVAANDEFFAPRESLLKGGAPEWREGAYTERGKWMDGWETRRRRSPGNDWAIIRLGAPGIVRGVVIDTSYFTGNFPESASVHSVAVNGTPSAEWLSGNEVGWEHLIPQTKLEGNCLNELEVKADDRRVTHLRLNIFPDGGVARLRVHGEVRIDPPISDGDGELDLAAMENGAYVVSCSDMHYGHRQNLILPGRSTHMGDGWETKRRRGPGHEWTIVRLAVRGIVTAVDIDTDHFKGNAPGSCMLEGCDAGDAGGPFSPVTADWIPIVPDVPLQPHARHSFDSISMTPVTHVRLNIYPDGGVARMRVIGQPGG
ncbi:MAG: allantoicase [Gemmatimonadota bacterium]|nr:allantoicase [Gemmatimonadota bacterium]